MSLLSEILSECLFREVKGNRVKIPDDPVTVKRGVCRRIPLSRRDEKVR